MERGALIRLAVQLHRPAVQRDQMARNGESKADPTCDVAVLLQGHERLEDPLLLFAVDAQTGIRYPEVNPGRQDFGAQCDLSTLCVFLRIAQQVQKDLAHAQGIRAEVRQTLGDFQFPMKLRRCGLVGQVMEGLHQ